MIDFISREVWLPLALGFALIAIFVSHFISKQRSARELAEFGPPPFNPIVIGLFNFLPGLGLYKMGWSPKKALAHSALNYSVILAALLWPNLPSGDRMKFILYALLPAAVYAERAATEAWKAKPKQSTPSA